MSYLLMLGSTPDLSAAEAASQYPQAEFSSFGPVLLADKLETPTLAHLTGCTKIAKVIASVNVNDLKPDLIADWIEENPRAEGKLIYALSFVGDRWNQTTRFPLECKRIFKERFSRPVRWFANTEGEVSAAATIKLGLIDEGYEFVIAIKQGTAHVAVTIEAQDADLWTKIDMDRPRRNAKNGMLPPKLAEIMVHLVGPNVKTLFDSFCGSGTIIEAAARNQIPNVYGSDILPLLVEDAKQNFAWNLEEGLIEASSNVQFAVADATKPIDLPAQSVDAYVSEGYLGQPLQGYEGSDVLEGERQKVEILWEQSLRALKPTLASDAQLVIVWPEYRTSEYQTQVSLSDELLKNIGYKREPFAIAGKSPKMDILYGRENQHIMRRIIKLSPIQE